MAVGSSPGSSSSGSTFKFSGISSGIDTSSITQKMLDVIRRPISQYQNKQAKVTREQTAWQGLNTRLLALGTATDKLSNVDTFQTRKVTTSAPELFTATAGAGLDVGTYKISVESMAQQHQMISAGFETSDASVGSGTVQIQVGPAQYQPITIEEGKGTLEGLRDAINKSGTGVQASILDTGATNGASRFRLVLNSSTTGSDGKMQVTFNLTGGSAPVMSDLVEAKDAHIKMANIDIYNSSNTIPNVVPGVTLELHSADPGHGAQLNVSKDNTAVQSAVQGVLDQYNQLADTFNENFKFDKASGTTGTLFGDGTAMALQQQVVDVVNLERKIEGGKYSSLASIGIGLGSDGHLSITDQKAFTLALNSAGDIQKLFTDPKNGITSSMKKMVDAATNTVTGTIAQENQSLQNTYDDLDKSITAKNEQVTRTQNTLEAMFLNMESTLSQLKSQSDVLNAQISAFTTTASSKK